jgi:hypothetical protein
MPVFVASQSTPLQTDNGAAVPSTLSVQSQQGFVSWYWVCAQIDPGPGQKRVGVLLVLIQQTLPGGGLLWSIYGGLAVQGGAWERLGPIDLQAHEVTQTADGIAVTAPAVVATFAPTRTGFGVAADFKQQLTTIALVATSVRGPTFEQAGGPFSKAGPIENGYWSIVDGVVHAGTVATPSYSVSGPGSAWFDYQQLGIAPMSTFTKLVLAATRPSSVSAAWLWLFAQLKSGTQFNVAVIGADLQSLQAGNAVRGSVANIWQAGAPPLFNIECTVQVMAWYDEPSSGGWASARVPHAVSIVIGASAFALVGIQSAASPPPALGPIFNGVPAIYESPASVFTAVGGGDGSSDALDSVGVGVIELRPSGPTAASVAAALQLPAQFLEAFKPSPAAQAIFYGGIAFIIAVLIVLLVVVPVVVSHQKVKAVRASANAARAPARPTPTPTPTPRPMPTPTLTPTPMPGGRHWTDEVFDVSDAAEAIPF